MLSTAWGRWLKRLTRQSQSGYLPFLPLLMDFKLDFFLSIEKSATKRCEKLITKKYCFQITNYVCVYVGFVKNPKRKILEDEKESGE
jgi:hypothetical protein